MDDKDDVSFDACKASNNSAADLSTDSNSTAEHSEDFSQTIPESSRLSIFQSITQMDDDKFEKDSENEMSVGSSADAKTDCTNLFKTMSMDDAQVNAEFNEAWSQGSSILEQSC